MKTEELEERILDVERVLALQDKRLEKLEEGTVPNPTRIAQAPDCNSQFEELKALLKRHDLSVQALQIYALIASLQEKITKLPKVLPVRHHHYFEDRSRGFVIGGIVCLLTVAISVGLSFSLYRENSRLEESDIKYRMVRQAYPDAVHWADSAFHQNSEDAKTWLENREPEAIAPLLQQK
ncbi:hypothetical protein Q4E40_05450 [Pontibacter sp. BT731]|uniref:hypothetical protein n=1 Tax=Pontibacter coccineus TaxID=3063328 RepID=UPI0026E17784|nr:hypothetical protein [Pontibacter sp. BT731]MDO6389561.1 hypothetical protein [Pontibacter sp. BT731]